MTSKERFLLLMTIVGFVVPNVLLAKFAIVTGALDFGAFLDASTTTLPATQIALDAAITAIVVMVWAAWDGPRSGVRLWWVVIPASLLVGICFGAPLYLFLRERAIRQATV